MRHLLEVFPEVLINLDLSLGPAVETRLGGGRPPYLLNAIARTIQEAKEDVNFVFMGFNAQKRVLW